MINMSMTVW